MYQYGYGTGTAQANSLIDGFEKIIIDGNSCYLDFAILSQDDHLIAVSFFKREAEMVKSIGASLMLSARCNLERADGKGTIRVRDLYGRDDAKYKMYTAELGGLDHFTTATVMLDPKAGHLLWAEEGKEDEAFYDYLMENSDLPLLPEWSKVLLEELMKLRAVYLDGCRNGAIKLYVSDAAVFEKEIPLNGGTCKLKNLRVLGVPKEDWLKDKLGEIVSGLIKAGRIKVCDKPQKSFNFETMDDYMKVHGSSLVDNLSTKITPLTELCPEATDFTTIRRPLYPQQIAMVNGVKALLSGVGNRKQRRKTASNYAILNEGMGCGKTLQAAAMIEAVAVGKEVRKGRKLEDIYSVEDESINYRVIVMCPGHLKYKWAREIENDIPYAKVEVIEKFSQLVQIRANGAKRNGREFYIMSKDFAKLDATEEPAVVHYKSGPYMRRTCEKCGRRDVVDKECPQCKSKKFRLTPTTKRVSGMVCPGCGNVCIPYRKIGYETPTGLMPADFMDKRDINAFCMYCGSSLWQPRVKNLRLPDQETKPKTWTKMTFWANEAHKNKRTVWVHKSIAPKLREQAVGESDTEGCRKTAPAQFIKHHMKGYFDLAVFDEVHTLKGGETAQGAAMHALCKVSKKQLALTGTIAGGYADHLFYLLWRLDPKRMKDMGYTWESRLKFIEKYGSLETTYDGEIRYNKMSKGRQTSQPKCKPGISPRIFTDFLLDRAVFLDVTDLSKYLPPLKEKVVLVDMDPRVNSEYVRELEALKLYGTNHGLGMRLMATQLQFSLSYPDKPFGRNPILDPKSGETILAPMDFLEYGQDDKLLSKEEALLNLLKGELAEGRNAFVYAEYTGMPETRISERLRTIMMKELDLGENEVVILDAEKVDASKREGWIADRAQKGAKIIITNPKCVETGLDFCFKVDGKSYNYPTIVFYQMGYSLFTIWQASRRHYRLNQRSECRTYYMGYRGTAQEALIGLVAKKMSATSAIQGKFSSEGLSAMAQGVDARVALAQAMSNMDFSTGNDLQQMFDVVAAEVNPRYEGAKRMRLLAEIVPVNVGKTENFFDYDDINMEAEQAIGDEQVVAEQTDRIHDDDDFYEFFDKFFGESDNESGIIDIRRDTNTSPTEPSATAEPQELVIKVKRRTRKITSQASFF